MTIDDRHDDACPSSWRRPTVITITNARRRDRNRPSS